MAVLTGSRVPSYIMSKTVILSHAMYYHVPIDHVMHDIHILSSHVKYCCVKYFHCLLLWRSFHSLGNVFTPVCHSVNRGGEWQTPPPPGTYTSPWDQTPQGVDTPMRRHPPREQTPPVQCMMGDMGNKWAECILVCHVMSYHKKYCRIVIFYDIYQTWLLWKWILITNY